MKAPYFRFAALIAILMLACIALPAIAQNPVAGAESRNFMISNSRAEIAAGTNNASMTYNWLTLSADIWIPVRDPNQGHGKGNHKKPGRQLTVPEGGSLQLYLLLALLSCCGAIILGRRRAKAPKA